MKRRKSIGITVNKIGKDEIFIRKAKKHREKAIAGLAEDKEFKQSKRTSAAQQL